MRASLHSPPETKVRLASRNSTFGGGADTDGTRRTPKGRAALKIGGREANKGPLASRRLELLEVAFNAHADEGRVHPDDLDAVLHGSLSRFLDREIDELKEEHDDSSLLQFHDVRNMVAGRVPFITQSWEELETAGTKERILDADDIFTQLYQAQKTIAGSCGGPGGHLEIHDMEYLLATCGEEVDHEEFDELLEKIRHPRKGCFEMQKLIMYIGGLLEEVGMVGSEELAKAASKKCDNIGKEMIKPIHSQEHAVLARASVNPGVLSPGVNRQSKELHAPPRASGATSRPSRTLASAISTGAPPAPPKEADHHPTTSLMAPAGPSPGDRPSVTLTVPSEIPDV